MLVKKGKDVTENFRLIKERSKLNLTSKRKTPKKRQQLRKNDYKRRMQLAKNARRKSEKTKQLKIVSKRLSSSSMRTTLRMLKSEQR